MWTIDYTLFEDPDTGNPTCIIWGPEGEGAGRIATVYGECGIPVKELAQQIAANPYLVEALEKLTNALGGITTGEWVGMSPKLHELWDYVTAARAALRKAKL